MALRTGYTSDEVFRMRKIKTETALKAIKTLSFGTLQHVTDLLGIMTRPCKRIFTVSVEDVVDGYN